MKNLKDNFLFAQGKVVESISKANGWNIDNIHPENLIPSIFFYVFDYETKWTWACSIPKDFFHETIKSFVSIDRDSIVSFCGEMIEECVSQKVPDENQVQMLAAGLTGYISITEIYKLTNHANKQNKQNHFVIIRYGAKKMLRPFAANGADRYLLQSELIQTMINQVISIDLKKHPEWRS